MGARSGREKDDEGAPMKAVFQTRKEKRRAAIVARLQWIAADCNGLQRMGSGAAEILNPVLKVHPHK
jgi:hypothetical protein